MSAFFQRKLLPALTVVFAICMLPCAAQAAKRIYFAGYMGLNIFPEQEFEDSSTGASGEIGLDNAYSFAGAIGFKLTPQLRLAGELNYLKADLNTLNITGIAPFLVTGDIETKMAMLNLYYDFDFNWKKLRPFVGAGIGYAWHEGDVSNVNGLIQDVNEETGGIIWQLGGGVRYPLGKDMNLTGAYRYLDGQNIELGPYDMDYGAHEIRLGISWDLPFE